MPNRWLCSILAVLTGLSVSLTAAPVIDPIPNAGIPAGKSLIIPVTATSPNGLPLTFSASSSTNRITVLVHTNNPFWKMSVAQHAPSNAPGAYQTPFRGTMETVTNIGDMTFMLFRDIAPHTVDVIQGLTESGMYTTNTIFHRVIAGFIIQGGDPLTNGYGGPVFRYDDEFNPEAMFSGTGQLALANSGPNTDGSQVFVTVAPYRYGDFTYTILGQLLRGFNVLSNVNNTPVDANSRPLADVIITRASFVPDSFDTVLTVLGTNSAGIAGTIKVVADDGAGGRTTNSFIATTVADSNLENPFLSPVTVTNLTGPINKNLTNFVFGYDFAPVTNNWTVNFADQQSSLVASNSFFVMKTNQLELVVVPITNYAGPVNVYVYLSANASFTSYYQQYYSFAIGDTTIKAMSGSNIVAQTLTTFSNQFIATFTNGIPNSSATNFTALINWGDNSTNNAFITTNGSGLKLVFGSHAYTNSGDYPIYTTIQSALGASATVVCTSTVPPGLTLSRAGTSNTVGWPAWAFSYHLLSNTNATGTNWLAVTNLAALAGYQNVVSNSSTNGKYFFRLKK